MKMHAPAVHEEKVNGKEGEREEEEEKRKRRTTGA